MSATLKAGTAGARARRGVPQLGEVVAGKYEVQDVIGAGGMGVVVAARHIELGQTVAIKFLDKSLVDNASASARFFREARAASKIRSEHVTRVLDVARTDKGVPYLVMEHLEGTDLERVQRTEGPLPIDAVLDYILQACEALAEAHAAGVIHRDLKPSNLFLTHRADGSPLVKVLDFGISKIIDPAGAAHDGAQTTETEMLGSTWYMSPEQVRSSMSVDARTDIWSLGVILFQLLTGIHAFRADSMGACLARIIADPPPPLRAARPEVPEGLERVILACLEKDPDRRLQSVAELAWSLSPFAPECARLSIQRITRVLGPTASAPTTLPLASFAAAPGAAPPERVATGRSADAAPVSGPAPTTGGPATPFPPPSGLTPSGLTPPPSGVAAPPLDLAPPASGQSTGASLSTTAVPPLPRRASRWPLALALAAACGVGGVAARYFLSPPRSVAATVTAPAPPGSVTAAAAPEASVAPAATATATAAATPLGTTSAAAPPPKTPEAPSPAPAAPRSRPGHRKITGPVETTL